MKQTWKNISTYVIVALISIGATYGMFTYLNKSNTSPSYSSTYGQMFDQENVHLANYTTAEGYPDFTKAAESSVNAVVHIKSTIQASQMQGGGQMQDPLLEYFFGNRGRDMQPQTRVGMGSGVVISADGYIITNNHVIDQASEIEVTLNDNTKYKARLVGADPATDIALLKVEAKEMAYVPFGNSDQLKVGEWVMAIGNPFNLTSTVTVGIVSAKGRGGIGADQGSIQSFIQTDAAINRGNSGGALVNTKGELIGINTSIYSQTGDFAGYGFAVPISIAGKVVADIKEYGTVQRARLGVMMSDLSIYKEMEPEKSKNIKRNDGAYISEFAEQSPAKAAGILEGDIIIAVNDVKIKSGSALQEQVSRYRPGDKIKLTVDRNNTEKTFNITLKNEEGNTSIVKKEDGIAIVGAAFKDIAADQKKEYGIKNGVEVVGVDSSGRFHEVGITKGFVIMNINNTAINTTTEVESMIRTVANGKEKVLFISGFYPATGSRKYYAVELNK